MTHAEKHRQTGMDPQGLATWVVRKYGECKCAVYGEDIRGHRRAVCLDHETLGSLEIGISFVEDMDLKWIN